MQDPRLVKDLVFCFVLGAFYGACVLAILVPYARP